MKVFDVSISLAMQCVVRAQSAEDAEGLAIQLAERFSDASQCLDGGAYRIPAATEFSVNFDPETFESHIDEAYDIEDLEEL